MVIVYLCLFMKHPNWTNPFDVQHWVLQNYPTGLPNTNAIILAIKNNKHIQEEEFQRHKTIRDEAESERLKNLAEE